MERIIAKTPDQIVKWFEENKSDVYSMDWETTGLNYLEMEPVGISFCNGKSALYCDLWENEHADEICRTIAHIFNGNQLFVAHHLKYDWKCCTKFLGTVPNNGFCTYIASYLLDENRQSHSLKVLAVEELGVPQNQISKWEDADACGRHSEEFYEYGMNDSIWAYQLYLKFKPQLTEQGLDHLFYNVEMPFVEVNAAMEMNGIKVDTDRLFVLQKDLRAKIIEIEDEMFQSIGMQVKEQLTMFGGIERISPFNLNSDTQLAKVIEDRCKLPIIEKTPTGKKAVNKETFWRLAGKHPFIDLLSDYKRLNKMMTGYVIPCWEMIDSDGRIRPNFGIVKTGRLNCTKPNLQQLPNRDKDPEFVARYPEINYRSIFVAEDGCSLVGGDYSGQELRVLGEVTQDATMVDAFNRNIDLHLLTANSAFGLGLVAADMVNGTDRHSTAKGTYAAERDRGKNGINFPIVYGTSPYGIAHRQSVSKETATEWINSFFKLYAGVKPAMAGTTKFLKKNGFVTTMMGRRRRLNYHSKLNRSEKGRMERQAFNFKIQGFSADQMKIAAYKAHKAGLKVLVIVHDEMILEVPEHTTAQAVHTLRDCMVNAVSLSIPFEVEIKHGKAYSDIK